MTNEEKELLLKDLCARLPYGVQCEFWGHRCRPYTFTGNDIEDLIAGRTFKPYLRPMSSMTTEEWCEYCDACAADEAAKCMAGSNKYLFYPISKKEDFLNSHHFDHHGLIPMGLASEAKEGMYD